MPIVIPNAAPKTKTKITTAMHADRRKPFLRRSETGAPAQLPPSSMVGSETLCVMVLVTTSWVGKPRKEAMESFAAATLSDAVMPPLAP